MPRLITMVGMIFFGLIAALGCAADGIDEPTGKPSQLGKDETTAKPGLTAQLVVAGGCFWCVESQLEMLKGVSIVESGYCGGSTKNPTYKEVCTGETGHAEAVRVTYDPSVIGAADLLRVFLISHDPTQLNRQGPDFGTQYRSAIFYKTDAEKQLAQKIIAELTKEELFNKPIVTTIEPLTDFYLAEDYHQDYYRKFEEATPAQQATMNPGYCSAVISPKISKFRERFKDLLKVPS